jgi:hypothetical protein
VLLLLDQPGARVPARVLARSSSKDSRGSTEGHAQPRALRGEAGRERRRGSARAHGTGGAQDALEPALDRFARFFVKPLFTAAATERELNAIESEHTKNLQQDSWRINQIMKLRFNAAHPAAKFGTGNKLTLKDATAEQGIDLRARSPPPPSPRTKWTRRVPHPVLIGHAASLPGCSSSTKPTTPRTRRARPAACAAHVLPQQHGTRAGDGGGAPPQRSSARY